MDLGKARLLTAESTRGLETQANRCTAVDSAPAPPREIPALIQQLWGQFEVLQKEIQALADRLAPVSAPRPKLVEADANPLKTQTGIGSELAGMVSLVDGQSARLREIAAALEL